MILNLAMGLVYHVIQNCLQFEYPSWIARIHHLHHLTKVEMCEVWEGGIDGRLLLLQCLGAIILNYWFNKWKLLGGHTRSGTESLLGLQKLLLLDLLGVEGHGDTHWPALAVQVGCGQIRSITESILGWLP